MSSRSLAEQAERLSGLLADSQKKLQEFYDGPLGEQEFCVVCKTARIRGDITGLTCGSPRCLFKLQDVLEVKLDGEYDSDLEDIHRILGIDESPANTKDAICEIKDRLDEAKEQLGLIAEIIFSENKPEGNIIFLLEKIREEIKRVKDALNKDS